MFVIENDNNRFLLYTVKSEKVLKCYKYKFIQVDIWKDEVQ